MATIIPVAYNPSQTPISGTEQVGDFAIGTTGQDYSNLGGVRFWGTPDLDLGYVVSHVNNAGDQPNPLSLSDIYVGFWRSADLTDGSFITLAEDISKWDGDPQTFDDGTDAKTWLNDNGYWTSWESSEPIIESFTSVGTTSWTAPVGVTSVEYLVVGGGGGGGNGYDTGGGGGGAGGMVLTGTLSVIPGNTYTVTVGSGGDGGPVNYPSNQNGNAGGNSVFSTITALGGDFGNGSRTVQIAVGTGGSAQVSDTTAPTGGDGGGNAGSAVGGSGGGGGGASGNGGNGSAGAGGTGGNGVVSGLNGSLIQYGRGGVGARGNVQTTGANGLANRGTGGGGGGCNSGCGRAGGKGGSGVVIIKY